LFWASLGLLLYVCAGYPLIVAAWAALKPRQPEREPFEPSVSVVISAHNEARSIQQKVANLLLLDYPADRLEILIGSDGSTDGTLESLQDLRESRVQVFAFPRRQGKPAVLNQLVPEARGEIVVLSDVRQQFDPQSLRMLIQPFADSHVGAVSGELILRRNPETSVAGEGAGAYWRYEKFIRSRESRIDSTVGATGAVYAIRKSLFEPIPEDTILDDVLIPLRITRRRYRVLFEPAARAYDTLPATTREEFTRKVRTLAGNFQLFGRERWLLSPLRNRLWWQTVSHKVLRLFIPVFQVLLFATNVALAGDSRSYQLTLIAQILFYGGAAVGSALHHYQRKFWPVTFLFTFCLLSWATVVGFLRHITGGQTVTWEKAASSR
jgi:biofilm PGA synthesis N-glycosyltransferase PgaC